jgi:hypothetical protein
MFKFKIKFKMLLFMSCLWRSIDKVEGENFVSLTSQNDWMSKVKIEKV